jgi:hypothetical protein
VLREIVPGPAVSSAPAIDNNNEIINGFGSASQARDIVVRDRLGCGCRRTPRPNPAYENPGAVSRRKPGLPG